MTDRSDEGGDRGARGLELDVGDAVRGCGEPMRAADHDDDRVGEPVTDVDQEFLRVVGGVVEVEDHGMRADARHLRVVGRFCRGHAGLLQQLGDALTEQGVLGDDHHAAHLRWFCIRRASASARGSASASVGGGASYFAFDVVARVDDHEPLRIELLLRDALDVGRGDRAGSSRAAACVNSVVRPRNALARQHLQRRSRRSTGSCPAP